MSLSRTLSPATGGEVEVDVFERLRTGRIFLEVFPPGDRRPALVTVNATEARRLAHDLLAAAMEADRQTKKKANP